jgi:hypothetical protein
LLRAFAQFAPSLQSHLRDPQLPPVAIITSQAAQYSVNSDFQLEAQRRAVRAMAYAVGLAPYVIAENQIDKLGSPKLAVLPSPQSLGEPAWRALMKFVEAGGSLLISGSVDRDEHWQIEHRAADLELAAHTEPLDYHNAAIRIGNHSIPLEFGQEQQNWLESMRFDDGSTLKEIAHGNGRIFWATYPVELSEDSHAAAELYAYVAGRIGLAPAFDAQSPVPAGVLVFPTEMADSVVYVFLSDSDASATINLRDHATTGQIAFTLPAEHAAIAVIGKKEKKIIAKYGF